MAGPAASSGSAASPPPTRALATTAALVGLQGLGLLAAGVLYVLEIVLGRADDLRGAVFVAVSALLAGAGLVFTARGIRAGRRWSRSPALVTQLFVVPVAWPLARTERWYVGWPLLIWALALIALLLSPAVGARLRD